MKLPSRRELPDYYEIIKKPLDIKKILQRVEESKVRTHNNMLYLRDPNLILIYRSPTLMSWSVTSCSCARMLRHITRRLLSFTKTPLCCSPSLPMLGSVLNRSMNWKNQVIILVLHAELCLVLCLVLCI